MALVTLIQFTRHSQSRSSEIQSKSSPIILGSNLKSMANGSCSMVKICWSSKTYPKLGGVGDLLIGLLDRDRFDLLLLLLRRLVGERGDLVLRRFVGVGDLL